MLDAKNMQGKILVVYYHDLGYPLRQTVKDSLYSFETYTNKLVYYINAAFAIPEYLKSIEFDLIIYHTILLSKRSLPRRFERFLNKSASLKSFKGYKTAFPQDEYEQTVLLSQFINEFGVDHIFHVTPTSEFEKVYSGLENRAIKRDRVLTGYFDEHTLNRVIQLSNSNIQRDIDIGYRANRLSYSLGRHALQKYEIGELFKEHLSASELKADISNDPKDTFLGMDWYKFLLRCKYTLGVEGGASILDPEGKIAVRVANYLKKHSNASFDEVEGVCFEGLDGNLKHHVISPRILEACATKTCQILIEGDYNGIMQPNKHYIELKKDFSNIEDVLQKVKKDDLRNQIVEQAYTDIIQCGKYTTNGFAQNVLDKSLGKEYSYSSISDSDIRLHNKNKMREKWTWKYIPVRSYIVNSILNALPDSLFSMLERFMKKT